MFFTLKNDITIEDIYLHKERVKEKQREIGGEGKLLIKRNMQLN